jgi:hypothetical protein
VIPHRPGRSRVAFLATVLLAVSLFPCRSALAQGRAQAIAVSQFASQTPGWSFHLSTEGAYESNPNFLAPPNDEGDFSGSGGGGFAYSHIGPKGSFSMSGDGRGLFYRELTGLNTFTFGGTMAGTYRPGARTQITFNASLMSDYTRRSDILLSQGIVLPQSQVLTMRFDAGLTHTLSTRTTFSLSSRFERAQFKAEGLNDGRTLGATATLAHRVSQTLSLALSYAHDDTKSDVQTRSIDSAYGTARLVLNPATDLEANLGVSSVGGALGPRTNSPYGGARIEVKKPRSLLGLGYSHQVRQDYGIGRVTEADLGSFYFTRLFGRRKSSFNTSLTYALNRSQSGLPASVNDHTYGATAGLQVPIARRLRGDCGYSYFRSSQQVVDSHTVFVAFSYRTELH